MKMARTSELFEECAQPRSFQVKTIALQIFTRGFTTNENYSFRFSHCHCGSPHGSAADDTTGRLERSVAVLNSINGANNGRWTEQIAATDCVAVIPGFKKGAAVVGFGHGRGFLSCRRGDGWSAPGAVTLETSSVGIQVWGEAIDIVVLFLDSVLRQKLLSGRFAVGTDASATWGNGKAAHEDPNAKVVFFGHTKGMFAGGRRRNGLRGRRQCSGRVGAAFFAMTRSIGARTPSSNLELGTRWAV